MTLTEAKLIAENHTGIAYHFTTLRALVRILESGVLKPSKDMYLSTARSHGGAYEKYTFRKDDKVEIILKKEAISTIRNLKDPKPYNYFDKEGRKIESSEYELEDRYHFTPKTQKATNQFTGNPVHGIPVMSKYMSIKLPENIRNSDLKDLIQDYKRKDPKLFV